MVLTSEQQHFSFFSSARKDPPKNIKTHFGLLTKGKTRLVVHCRHYTCWTVWQSISERAIRRNFEGWDVSSSGQQPSSHRTPGLVLLHLAASLLPGMSRELSSDVTSRLKLARSSERSVFLPDTLMLNRNCAHLAVTEIDLLLNTHTHP